MTALVKESLITARRANDDELAKLLSEVKQWVKSRKLATSNCVDCGVVIKAKAARCYPCGRIKRYYPNRLRQAA